MRARVNLEALAGRLGRWRPHWPILAILALAAAPLLINLDQDYLWSDEGDTAVLAKNILKFGVPAAWDGVTFTDSDFGARVNDDLVMVSHPWLQYYVTAVSFAIFGESPWAARLPFALLGLLTLGLVYLIVHRVAANRWTAASASALLMLSVQFLIYARQSRHYTLNAALTCLLVLQFTRLTSWRGTTAFAIVGVLLFHSHPIGLVPILVMGLLTMIHEPFRPLRPWFLRAAPIIAVFTLPWLVVASRGYAENTGMIQSAATFLPRLGQFAVECASVSPVVGALVLLGVAWRQHRRTAPAAPARGRRPAARRRGDLLTPHERGFIVTVLAIIAGYAVTMALTQPRDEMFALGLRYTPAVIPFMAMITALLIAKVSRGSWRPWVAVLLVLGFTKLGRTTPWTFWEEPRPRRDSTAAITFHTTPRAIDRVLRTGQIAFVQSLFKPNPGTTARVAEFLNAHAAPRDIVVTNYGWEPLYFHTGLPQGMTVQPSYPIYGAAKARGLPAYVFSAHGARWIVWRKAWDAYRGQPLAQVLDSLRAANVPVTLVATIPETLWENRENIHFRRYPGNRYIYPWFGDVPETVIYRIG